MILEFDLVVGGFLVDDYDFWYVDEFCIVEFDIWGYFWMVVVEYVEFCGFELGGEVFGDVEGDLIVIGGDYLYVEGCD